MEAVASKCGEGWRACQNILPTRENMCSQKVIADRSCPLCGLEEETIYHVLW
jgi:hypothetical protein